MKPESAAYLAKARESLAEARKIHVIGLANAAARSAYYAAFHAAEALIIEQTGRAARSHRGVRSQFAKLVKDTDLRGFTAFLARAYSVKEIADYSIDPGTALSAEEGQAVIDMAEKMVASVTSQLDERQC